MELTLSQNLCTADRFIHQNSIPMYKNRTHTHHTLKSRTTAALRKIIYTPRTLCTGSRIRGPQASGTN